MHSVQIAWVCITVSFFLFRSFMFSIYISSSKMLFLYKTPVKLRNLYLQHLIDIGLFDE
jgi:hypothetical protein